jgi:hypothetical protein
LAAASWSFVVGGLGLVTWDDVGPRAVLRTSGHPLYCTLYETCSFVSLKLAVDDLYLPVQPPRGIFSTLLYKRFWVNNMSIVLSNIVFMKFIIYRVKLCNLHGLRALISSETNKSSHSPVNDAAVQRNSNL